MTAELLGKVIVFSAFAKTAIAVSFQSSSAPASQARPRCEAIAPGVIRNGERGFTMTELMVTVGIVAILTAVAAPPLMAMIATQQVKSATFDLYSALSYARSEAIKRNSVVTVTPLNGAFSNGYDLTAGGSLLRRQIGSPQVSIIGPANAALAFDGLGRLTTTARYQLELTSGNATTPKRCLVISNTGRPSIRVDTNRDGNCING